MAQRVNVVLVDDLDGSEATETVAFGLDGKNYEIDLSEDNATSLRLQMAHYIEAAREVRGRRRTTNRITEATRPGKARPKPKEVREWAATQGIEVSGTGRIPNEVVEQYQAAVAS